LSMNSLRKVKGENSGGDMQLELHKHSWVATRVSDTMKMSIRSLAIVGLLVFPVPSVRAQSEVKPQISVSGSAEIKVAPNEVHLNVGVETRDESLDGAKQRNDDRVSKALSFLKQNGIKGQDIQTDYLVVEPIYDEHANVSPWTANISPTTGLPIPVNEATNVPPATPLYKFNERLVEPIYYVVRKSIGIKLTEVSSFDRILSGLITNGVNNVQRVDFRSSELGQLQNQTRTMAVRSAREKAQAMASELGVKVGKPLFISADDWSGWSSWSPPGKWSYGTGGGGGGSGSTPQSASDQAGVTFAVGRISITATVRVTFLLE